MIPPGLGWAEIELSGPVSGKRDKDNAPPLIYLVSHSNIYSLQSFIHALTIFLHLIPALLVFTPCKILSMAQPTVLRNVWRVGSGIKYTIGPPRILRPAFVHFSTTAVWRNIRTTDMTEQQLAAVKINPGRLWKDLHETCEWGKGERWGE